MSLATENPCYNLARSISKALKRRKTLYATGPMTVNNAAQVDVTMNGIRYHITVREEDVS